MSVKPTLSIGELDSLKNCYLSGFMGSNPIVGAQSFNVPDQDSIVKLIYKCCDSNV